MPENTTRGKTIKHWSSDERPRERLLRNGSRSLSNAELLGILLGTGSRTRTAIELARDLLDQSRHSFHRLAKQGVTQWQKVKGVGPAKAVNIAAALELGRRMAAEPGRVKGYIRNSQSAFTIAKPYVQHLNHEEFWIMTLDRSQTVQDVVNVSAGGIAGTVVDPRIIFKHALDRLATGLIIFHNHPSGQRKPSKADREITRKLREGGKLLDIQLIDHLIITDSGYTSFADNGWIE